MRRLDCTNLFGVPHMWGGNEYGFSLQTATVTVTVYIQCVYYHTKSMILLQLWQCATKKLTHLCSWKDKDKE
jgi:hypothetical protein